MWDLAVRAITLLTLIKVTGQPPRTGACVLEKSVREAFFSSPPSLLHFPLLASENLIFVKSLYLFLLLYGAPFSTFLLCL